MAQPFVSAPIIGANSVHQLTNSMGAVELRVSKADLAEISNAAAPGNVPVPTGRTKRLVVISSVLKCSGRARPNECALRWKMVIEAL
jgi:hypothetical protein